jgi:hypothetical protein
MGIASEAAKRPALGRKPRVISPAQKPTTTLHAYDLDLLRLVRLTTPPRTILLLSVWAIVAWLKRTSASLTLRHFLTIPVNCGLSQQAHFATFPQKLIEPCILAGSQPGDVVLDPFIGSGTVGKVCERFGRRWVGIDLSPSYLFNIAKRRTAQRGLGL